MRWLASLANLGVKSRILSNAYADENIKATLTATDWHFGVGPSYVREVRSASGLAPLRTFRRPLLVLAPAFRLAESGKMFSTPPAHIEVARGVKDPQLMSLNPVKLGRLADRIAAFAELAHRTPTVADDHNDADARISIGPAQTAAPPRRSLSKGSFLGRTGRTTLRGEPTSFSALHRVDAATPGTSPISRAALTRSGPSGGSAVSSRYGGRATPLSSAAAGFR